MFLSGNFGDSLCKCGLQTQRPGLNGPGGSFQAHILKSSERFVINRLPLRFFSQVGNVFLPCLNENLKCVVEMGHFPREIKQNSPIALLLAPGGCSSVFVH